MSTINQRIRDIFVHSGERNASAFAKTVGIPQSTMSEYMNTDKEPKYSALVKIAKKYSDISLEWLFLGEGTMLRTAGTEVHSYSVHTNAPKIDVKGDNNITGNTGPVTISADVEELKKENEMLKKKNEELTERCFTLTDKLTKLL